MVVTNLIAVLAVSQVNGDVDSTGTDFLTIFPWNNNDVDHFPVVAAIDFINSDETTTATVDISYSVYAITGDDITTTMKTKRITVGKKSKETVSLRLFFGLLCKAAFEIIFLLLSGDHRCWL